MNITDLGRVLNAMLQDVENCVGASYLVPQKMLASALRAGAAKCVEIAKEQLDDDAPASEPGQSVWIEHTGYKMPNIDQAQRVEIERVNGMRFIGAAGNFFWGMPSTRSTQIARYRVIDNAEQIT